MIASAAAGVSPQEQRIVEPLRISCPPAPGRGVTRNCRISVGRRGQSPKALNEMVVSFDSLPPGSTHVLRRSQVKRFVECIAPPEVLPRISRLHFGCNR